MALGWFLLLAAIRVGNEQDWNPVLVPVVALGIFGIATMLMLKAVSTAREIRAEEEVFD